MVKHLGVGANKMGIEINKIELLKLTNDKNYIEIINLCYELSETETINSCDFSLYLDLLEKKGLITFWKWFQNNYKNVRIDKT